MAASRRRLRVVAASTIIALAAVGVWIAVDAWRGFTSTLGHAYMADYAAHCATQAVEKYVRERQKWPTSWRELESLPTTLPSGGWDEIRTYVEINFDLTIDEVAKQRVEDFGAIKPVEPVLGHYRDDFPPLLETVRSVQRTRDRNGDADERDQP
jgi:hypothetical protein